MTNLKVKKTIDRLIDRVIIHSWWVLLFVFVSVIGYSQAIKKKKRDIYRLRLQLNKLEKERGELLIEKDDYMVRINSQSDDAWIEMILMKKLGLVPKDQIKIHFSEK